MATIRVFNERLLVLRVRAILWRADKDRTRVMARELAEFVDAGKGADFDAALDRACSNAHTQERAVLAGLRSAAMMR